MSILEKERNLGDLAEEEGSKGADSLNRDPLGLVSSRPGVHIHPAPMRHVTRLMGENAIGLLELALIVEVRAISLTTAPVPVDLG